MHYAALESCIAPTRYYYARRRFTAAAGAQGTVDLATDQYALLWLNGAYLGRTFVRAHADEWRAQTFDLTPHLRAGENVLALLVHSWGAPHVDIPGTPVPVPAAFACTGTVGEVDLGDLAAWRVAPAVEYGPAPRQGAIIGHEENRDLRREPFGWRELGFDDSTWTAPVVCPLTHRRLVPSLLRPLAEEVRYPARIVTQGPFTEGAVFVAQPPTPDHHYWQVQFSLTTGQTLVFAYENWIGAYVDVDGTRYQTPLDPPADWMGPLRPLVLRLSAGAHTLAGYYPGTGHTRLGWSTVPDGATGIRWATSPEEPFVPMTMPLDVDREHTLLMDGYQPADDPRCALKPDGQLDLTVEDAEYAVILEFPESITMLPRVEILDATAGVQLELIYSERLSDLDGFTIPGAYIDRATLREGAQTWEVSFQYKSARILILRVRAQGGRVTIGRVWATYRHYDYDMVGAFASSDERLNRIWQLCAHTMEHGSQDFIMDGPWREQLLYIGDNQVHNQAAYYLYGNHEIVEWQHTLYAQGQMPDGLFQPNQPCRTAPKEYRLLDQTILWPQQLEHHLLYTGREAFIRDLLPNMVRLLDGFQGQFGRLDAGDPRLRDVTGWNWVDHPGITPEGVYRAIRHDGIPTAINLLYLAGLQSATRMLAQFGQTDDATRFAELAQHLATCLRREHWDGARQRFADCEIDGQPSTEASVHVNLLAIEAGLADDPVALLDRTWRQPGVLQILGPFFRLHLFEVLHRLGRVEELLAEMRTVWGEFLDAGLTTTAENHAINGEFGASVGHPWGASPAIYLAKSVAGLYPVRSGWSQAVFDPQLADLPQVRVTVPTPHGPIEAVLSQEHGQIHGVLSVPETIELVMPRETVREQVTIIPIPVTRERIDVP